MILYVVDLLMASLREIVEVLIPFASLYIVLFDSVAHLMTVASHFPEPELFPFGIQKTYPLSKIFFFNYLCHQLSFPVSIFKMYPRQCSLLLITFH